MSLRRMALGFIIASSLAAVGCGDDDGMTGGDSGMPPPGDGGASESRVFVINTLDVGQADPAGDPNIVPGFDLDMHNTTSMSDPMGCGFIDYSSGSPDNIMGVDNNLGPILSGIAGSVDIPGAIRDNINDGTVLILMEVTGINSFTNDDSIRLNLYRGVIVPRTGDDPCMPTPPMLGADMLLSPGQTFDVDRRSYMADGTTPLVSATGRIVNGRLQAGPTDFMLNIDVMSMPLTLNIRQSQIRFNITPSSGINTGLLGGALRVAEVVSAVAVFAPDLEMTILTVLGGQADLEPDGMGVCQAVSIGLTYAGVPAVKGATVMPPSCTPDAGPPTDAGPPRVDGSVPTDGGVPATDAGPAAVDAG